MNGPAPTGRSRSLETSIATLAEATLFVLGFALLLTADRQDSIRQFNVDVFLLETGQLDLDLLLCLAHLHIRLADAERR